MKKFLHLGTMSVEAIWFSYSKTICFSKEAMKNMQRLRILHIRTFGYESQSESIEYLSNKLCWFSWHHYPWKLLPQNFNPRSLVHLDLQWGSLHHLWNETKQLLSLLRLNLSGSKSLKRTPDFSGMPNLEYLDLSYCESLEEVHHSLRFSKKLIQLNLYKCVSLESFPYVNVESLEHLDLYYCSSLEKFPEILGRMKPELEIITEASGIRELSSSFIHRKPNLTEVDLSGMNTLVSLPSCICKLKDLVKLDVSNCSNLESLPEEIGDLENLEELHASMTLISRPPSSIVRLNKLKVLNLSYCNLIDGGLPEDIGSLSSLEQLDLRGNNFEHLPRSIAQLGALQTLGLSDCKRLTQLPEEIGDLEKLKSLDASMTLISRSPSSIVRLNKLKVLNLRNCNLIDGGLLEDVGSLSSLEQLDLHGNDFEHLPRSIAQLGALQYLDLSNCNRLTQLPEEIGDLENLEYLYASVTLISRPPSSIIRLNKLKVLDLSYCNLIDGGLPEDIGSLSSLEVLDLRRNNFEHLPRSIAQLGALRSLDLKYCKRLKELPEIPQQLYTINADWSNDWICNSLFQNISSLQHDISVSDSLSPRVFTSWLWNIPSWFHNQGKGASVSVNFPENWYVSDKLLGFAVCYSGKLIDIKAHLIPLCNDDGTSWMTQKFALSNHSYTHDKYGMHFFLVPLAGLWDASKANGKTPNDYEIISLVFGEWKDFGVRLLYKDEPELHIGIRRSRYEGGSCSSCNKQRPLLQLFPTTPGL